MIIISDVGLKKVVSIMLSVDERCIETSIGIFQSSKTNYHRMLFRIITLVSSVVSNCESFVERVSCPSPVISAS